MIKISLEKNENESEFLTIVDKYLFINDSYVGTHKKTENECCNYGERGLLHHKASKEEYFCYYYNIKDVFPDRDKELMAIEFFFRDNVLEVREVNNKETAFYSEEPKYFSISIQDLGHIEFIKGRLLDKINWQIKRIPKDNPMIG